MNPFEMMKNFGDMKKQLENAQAELSKITATGSAGGNMVVITMNGNFEVLDIKLDPICVDNRDVPMLQDLIKAAHHNALEKIQEQIKSNAGSMLSGMNIPGMNI
jgi:DNA-binding YbaB/EbfC family protein